MDPYLSLFKSNHIMRNCAHKVSEYWNKVPGFKDQCETGRESYSFESLLIGGEATS